MRKACHNRMTAVHTRHFLVLVIAAAFERLCYNRRKILIVTDVDKFRVRYNRCCENPVAVALSYRHNAVCREQYRSGNIMKFRLLILPARTEIAFQVLVFFEFGIPVCREHFTVGVDVYTLALRLFEQQLYVVHIMTADHYKRTFFYRQRNDSRHGISVAFGVCTVKERHTPEIHFACFKHKT